MKQPCQENAVDMIKQGQLSLYDLAHNMETHTCVACFAKWCCDVMDWASLTIFYPCMYCVSILVCFLKNWCICVFVLCDPHVCHHIICVITGVTQAPIDLVYLYQVLHLAASLLHFSLYMSHQPVITSLTMFMVQQMHIFILLCCCCIPFVSFPFIPPFPCAVLVLIASYGLVRGFTYYTVYELYPSLNISQSPC